jgi:hypothetical protein
LYIDSPRKIKKTRTYDQLSQDVLIKAQAFGISKFQKLVVIFLAGVLLTTATVTSSYGQADLAQPVQSQVGLPNTMFISANSTVHELPLKAMNTNGQVSKVSGFKIDMAKVALIRPSSPNINAFSNDPSLTMVGAKIRANEQGIDLQGTANTYSLAGLAQGVYTLDVIAQKGNNQGAYETILVIGPAITPQIQNVVQQKIVQETNIDIDNTKVIFENNTKPPKQGDKDSCLYDPSLPECSPINGECPEGFNMNEDGQCYPDKTCPPGYWRADDDESGACVPRTVAAAQLDESILPPCDGSLQDCVTENGDVCEANSTEPECELDEAPEGFEKAPIIDGEDSDFDGGDELDVEDEEDEEDKEDEEREDDVDAEIEAEDEGGEE